MASITTPRTFTRGRLSIIRYAADDYAARFDGQIIGSARSEDDAWIAAANHEYTLATHGTLPPPPTPDTDPPAPATPDPWEPYSGVPLPNDGTLPADMLTTARAFYAAYYEDHPDLVRAADRALTALTSRRWQVLDNGDLLITGSQGTTYRSGSECLVHGRTKTNRATGKHGPVYCPSYQRGQGPRCYHQVARELVRLAQVFLGMATTTPNHDHS